jgi:hypothetical protein
VQKASGCYPAAPILTAAARGGADFRAARSKSAKTKLRHAHRLFSSDHQPSSASRDARPPARILNTIPSSGSMDNARVDSVVKSPDLAVAIRATFSGHQDQ